MSGRRADRGKLLVVLSALEAVAVANAVACHTTPDKGGAPAMVVAACSANSSGATLTANTPDGSSLTAQVVPANDGLSVEIDIRVDGQPFLQGNATDRHQRHLLFGPAFHGISSMDVDSNGDMLIVRIDGRQLQPFAMSDPTAQLSFEDGTSLPLVSIDPHAARVAEALVDKATQSLASCVTAGASAPSPVDIPIPRRFPPLPFPIPFSGCDFCEIGCDIRYDICLATTPPCPPDASGGLNNGGGCIHNPQLFCKSVLAACDSACTGGCPTCCADGTTCDALDQVCVYPPPPPFHHTFEIQNAITSTLRFYADATTPFGQAFGPTELHSVPNLSLADVNGQAPVEIFLNPSGISDQNQAEAYVFARDPEETYQTLSALVNDDADWTLNTSDSWLPPAYYIASPYGPSDTTLNSSFVDSSYFWSFSPPAGPGAAPRGTGSIKAARLYQRGWCSTEQSIADILDQVSYGFTNGVLDPNGDLCTSPLNGNVYWTHATSYLRHIPGEPDASRGGFRFASSLEAFDPSGLLPSCPIDFNIGYDFVLTDGRLDASPFAPDSPAFSFDAPNNISCDGPPAGSGIAQPILDGIEQSIPKQIHDAAVFQQSFPQPWDSDPIFDLRTACDPNNVASACLPAMDKMILGIISGENNGSGLTSADLNNFVVPVVKDPNNWRCAQYNRGTFCENRCEYIVRAQRINVLPDAVELVWFDDPHDFAAPANPLYWLTWAQGPDGYRALCSRPQDFTLAGGPFGQRAFADLRTPGQLGCQFPSQSGPPSPPPPPPPPDPCATAAAAP